MSPRMQKKQRSRAYEITRTFQRLQGKSDEELYSYIKLEAVALPRSEWKLFAKKMKSGKIAYFRRKSWSLKKSMQISNMICSRQSFKTYGGFFSRI